MNKSVQNPERMKHYGWNEAGRNELGLAKRGTGFEIHICCSAAFIEILLRLMICLW